MFSQRLYAFCKKKNKLFLGSAHLSSLDPLTFSIFVRQHFIDEVCCLLKENTDVEVVCVAGWHAVVDDACAGVELSVGVDVHEGVSLRGVQDVSDAQTLQTHCVCRHKSAKQICISEAYFKHTANAVHDTKENIVLNVQWCEQ